ncbi:hypothetical protein [Aquimarina rubra]|uniref:Bacteriocin n=1 Tax=Aquimarina rubra TaxID=1920033 RepID=A0ABW5LLY7_9FLAO
MKKILNLKGIQKLTKEDQQQIKGSSIPRRYVYCGAPGMCCMAFLGGPEYCDFGYCQPNGTCIWA